MDDLESVSDSELDLSRDVFDETGVVSITRRGLKCRRSSVGLIRSTEIANDSSPSILLQPVRIIELLRVPSVRTYTTLKKKLDKSKNEPGWISDFLHNDGLDLLFESLEQLCKTQSDNFLNVILQESCIECVKTVMDSSLSLDYIIENKEFTTKLASALATDNVTVKQQVFELLSALCVYSKDGYSRALDALEYHKNAKKQKYRFSFVVEELRQTESLGYKTILLEFINCIIIYTDKINERIRIRNEFYGLKLQEVLNQLRNLADKDPNLLVQLDLFDEHKDNDEEQLPGAKGIDLTSPLDVFHTIYKQVDSTPQEIHFLTVLQHLLKIDPSEKTAEVIWDTVETLVGKATVIESVEDSKKLLQSFAKKFDNKSECKCTCSCHTEGDRHRLTSPRRSTSGVQDGDEQAPPVPPRMTSPPSTPVGAPPPPPPPPPGGSVPPAAPPLPPGMGAPPAPPGPPGVGAPPPPPIGGFLNKQQKKLPQQNIPKPKSKMRTLQWQKIPVNKVMGKNNLWTLTGQMFNGYVAKMDYEQIEDLFGVNKMKTNSHDTTDGSSTIEKKKKESSEVNLLDGKRSLNVNIFLKQFRMPNEEIVQLLQDGQSDKFGSEKLKSLQKILPTQEEVDLFRSFDGDRAKLGSAEKFFMCLMGLPNYRLRVDGLLIKEEFNSNIEYIRPSIDSVIEAAKDIKENKNLHELLYLVLLAGNFLNAGNYAGDAAGFKLSSLLKLTEIRANKPRMNLMHYVVMQAEEKNPALLNFPDEMKFLKDASLASIENLTADIRTLDEKMEKINKNIGSVGADFRRQMEGFLKSAKKEMFNLKEDLKDMESLRLELADFFCEDEKSFKLEECFKTLQTFCDRFNKAKSENDQRKAYEAKMEAKKRQKEAELQKKSEEEQTPEDPEGKGSIVEMLLADVRSGFKKFGETNFSVTKIQKISLENTAESPVTPKEEVGSGFVRGGTGRRSIRAKSAKKQDTESSENDTNVNGNIDELNQTGSRRSYAVDTDGTLFDILMQPESETAKSPAADGSFVRTQSLRRRSQNRRQQREGHGSLSEMLGRERAPSPNIEAQKKEIYDTKERPKSDILDDNFDYRAGKNVRRTRSMYDRATSLTPDGTPNRMYDPNNNKSEDNLSIDRKQSPFRSDDPLRRSSRFRSENDKSLPIIDEKSRLLTPTKELDVTSKFDTKGVEDIQITKDDSFATIEKKNKEKLARRFSSSSLNQTEIRRVLETAEDVKNKTDEHSVSMSVRTKLNKRWKSELDKSDIDKVLKAIEETGKQIDEMVKSEPVTQKSTETVTATCVDDTPVDKKVVPQGDPNEPEHLKAKRNKRKMRSNLSMDDIHAAFKRIDTPEKTEVNNELNTNEIKPVESEDVTPKSPLVPPRRNRKSNENTNEKPESEEKNEIDKETMSKAAKLAGKKRFRDQRFGDKDKDSLSQKAMLEHSQGRWKSNVEKENIDEAFRDYVSKNNMSRSKSYDEAVARKAMNDGDFNFSNEEKRNSLRNSAVNMFTDGRRNGRIFADDDSDAETVTQGSSSPRRPSSTASTRSDSPKSSSSRLSIKSTNTSTETLRETCSDGENSPAQSRRDSSVRNVSDIVRDSQTPSPSLTNKISESYDTVRPVTPSSLFSTPIDENDDLPQAAMLKWRKKRDEKRRQSFYDNVQGLHGIESGNLSPRAYPVEGMKGDNIINSPRSDGSLQIIHKPQGSNELLQNEIGSRCSYASSSDSASRDEGFETMSGTVSQRTSLSSTLESEFQMPSFSKKPEPMSKLQINENIIVAGARSSVIDTKKERTESWTEAVANNVGNIQKDSSLDSSMEYSATSPDSGHGTLKEEVWAEHSDLESTIKSTPSSRPMSPASSIGVTKKDKKLPSYMRGTTSSSKRTKKETPEADDKRRSSSSSTTPVSRSGRLSKGSSNQSLSKAKTGSNTSIASITSNASGTSTSQTVKKRQSLGGPRERPSSIHSSMPGSRSTTPLSHTTRAQTPTHRVAAKPAAHATSTVGARNPIRSSSESNVRGSTSTTPKTIKSRLAPTPPSGRSKTPTPTTPGRSTTSSSSRLRSTTPVNHHASQSSLRATTPSIEEEDEIDPNAPSRLKRSQSMRVKSSQPRPSFGSTSQSKEAPAKSATPRRSFMSPTASSKARLEKLKVEEGSPPPTPPPRRSKDTDSLPSKTNTTPSPLKRAASLRLPGKSASKVGKEHEKTNDNKIKGFIQKIGGSGSKIRPESDCSGKLAPVDESAEGTDEQSVSKEGGKSPSLRKILGLKAKDKNVRKSTDSLKGDSSEKKRKPSK